MRVHLFGCPIDILTKSETLDRVHDAMRSGEQLHHVAINAAKLVNMQKDDRLARDIKRSHIVGIDGMAIAWSLKFFGWKDVERVSGIDLMDAVLALSAREGFRPYFLGAKPDIVARAAEKVRDKYPGIEFAGIRDGYFRDEEEAALVEEIKGSGADCLFVGMPTPRKENFLARNRDALNVPFVMGVGGSFDVWAGHVERAPDFMQRHGLEWLFRIYQEPRRMWWRYARTNTIFIKMLLVGFLNKKLTGSTPTKPDAPEY